MLERLIIRNLAVIPVLDLELHPGLTVLSGETGAGKSIIVDALSLLLGGRASGEMIRSGADKAFVQGVFSIAEPDARQVLAELGLDEGDTESGTRETIITREISASKSVCRINGRVVTQATLKALGEHLADMHGQHEHQSLLQPARHLGLIDRFAGVEGEELLAGLAVEAALYRQYKKELGELTSDERERARLSDLFSFQISEIAAARLRPGEEEEQKAERLRLLNFEKLHAAVERSFADLYTGQGKSKAVIDVLGRVQGELREVSRHAPELREVASLLEQASYLVDDACRSLGTFKDNLTFEPLRLASIEERLDAIGKLKRKYGDSVEQILLFAKSAEDSLLRLHNSRERAGFLEGRLKLHFAQYEALASRLRALRLAKGEQLAEASAKHLRDLGMKDAELRVVMRPQEASLVSASGTETMEFLFTSNPGEGPKPLGKIASGGELSRVMLALKAVFSGVDDIPTLVFDEIDSGVGGKAAQSVAEKIASVSVGRQVICISHLAPIAAFADHHLCVQKKIIEDKTVTEVHHLDMEGRRRELARMLSGAESTAALTHAQELLAVRQRVSK